VQPDLLYPESEGAFSYEYFPIIKNGNDVSSAARNIVAVGEPVKKTKA
jgi:hypothetical protein